MTFPVPTRNSAEPLVFVHIPKTAGTTLHKILVHQVPRQETAVIHWPTGEASDAVRRLLLQQAVGKPRLRLVLGHIGLHVLDFLPDARCVTCLRDPVARVISHYQHACNDSSHYLHEVIRQQHLDLAAYVSGGWSGEVSNGMVRTLAGVVDYHQAVVDATSLEAAKRNLRERFLLTCLAERFDESVLLLVHLLGWRSPWYLRRKVGAYDPAAALPDKSTRRVIEEFNRYDLELYAYAKELFERKLQENLPDMECRLTRFRSLNHKLGPVVFCARELFHRAGMRPWF